MTRECKQHPGMFCPIGVEDLSGSDDYVCPLGEVVKVKCCHPMYDQVAKKELIDIIAMRLFKYCPINELPQPCIDKVQKLCKEVGGCGEVVLACIREGLDETLLDNLGDGK